MKNKKTSVLDPKKAYNICECVSSTALTRPLSESPHLPHPPHLPSAILLGHLKLPAQAIKQAVLSCDDSVLAEQHLRQMEAFAPDKKEVGQ